MWVKIQQSYKNIDKYFQTDGKTYHEKSKSVSHSLHKEFILTEVFFVYVQNLGIVEVADEEKSDEKSDDHINTCETKQTRP